MTKDASNPMVVDFINSSADAITGVSQVVQVPLNLLPKHHDVSTIEKGHWKELGDVTVWLGWAIFFFLTVYCKIA